MIIRTDPDFMNFMPQLSQEEYKLLEQDILANQCINAIVVWDNIIIDGHNRYKICKEHGIPFRIEKKSFNCKTEALIWMGRHQLGRRNLDIPTKIAMGNKIVQLQIEKEKAAQQDSEKRPFHKSPTSINEEIADITGISKSTVYKYTIAQSKDTTNPNDKTIELQSKTVINIVDRSVTHDKNGKTYYDNSADHILKLNKFYKFADEALSLAEKPGDKRNILKQLNSHLARIEEIMAEGELV